MQGEVLIGDKSEVVGRFGRSNKLEEEARVEQTRAEEIAVDGLDGMEAEELPQWMD